MKMVMTLDDDFRLRTGIFKSLHCSVGSCRPKNTSPSNSVSTLSNYFWTELEKFMTIKFREKKVWLRWNNHVAVGPTHGFFGAKWYLERKMFSFHPKSEEIDVFAQSSIFLWILIEEARIHDWNLKRHTNLNIQIIVQRQLWDVLQTRAYILLQCINIIESKTNDWIVGKMCEKVPINYRLISTKNSYTKKSQRQRTYYGCLLCLWEKWGIVSKSANPILSVSARIQKQTSSKTNFNLVIRFNAF